MPADIRSFFGGGAKASQGSQGSQKKEEVRRLLWVGEREINASPLYLFPFLVSFLFHIPTFLRHGARNTYQILFSRRTHSGWTST